MGATLEIIRLRDIIPVREAPRFVPGLEPRTIELKGDDFRAAEKIFINDVEVPEFVIVNRSTIFAQLPSTVEQVATVSIISNKFTLTTNASKLTYEIGDKTRLIDGIEKLVQQFVWWLLTSPGRDIFRPNLGGGLLDLVGQITSTKRNDKILGLVARSVSTTATQMRQAQANKPGLPLSERLLSATLLDIRMAKRSDELFARVLVENFVGTTGITQLEL